MSITQNLIDQLRQPVSDNREVTEALQKAAADALEAEAAKVARLETALHVVLSQLVRGGVPVEGLRESLATVADLARKSLLEDGDPTPKNESSRRA